jgi:hypothetical protein
MGRGDARLGAGDNHTSKQEIRSCRSNDDCEDSCRQIAVTPFSIYMGIGAHCCLYRASFPNMIMDTSGAGEASPAPCDIQKQCYLPCLLNPVKSSSGRQTQIAARLGKRRRRYASLGRLLEAVGEFDQSRLATRGASEGDTQRRGFRGESLRKRNGGGIRNDSKGDNYRRISCFGRYGCAACARKDERI